MKRKPQDIRSYFNKRRSENQVNNKAGLLVGVSDLPAQATIVISVLATKLPWPLLICSMHYYSDGI